ncbi:MAG: glycosyltransferase, partial [Acidobacteriaceae bacterium]
MALISPTQELEIRLPRRVPRSHIHNFLPEDALNEHLPAPEEQSRELHLIHAARLSEGKGTFLYLEVCRELRDAGVRFRATLAGHADEEVSARIRETIRTYGLSSDVEWVGHVQESHLISLLNKSDILIHLSSIDSYPLVVLESIACSTFPICVDLAGASDMVTRYTGHIVQGKEAVRQTVAFLK